MITEWPNTLILLVAIVGLAAFQQTISGFGFALVIMPLATLLFGLQVAAPLVAVVGLTLYVINLARYHDAIHFGHALRLGSAAILGVPVGIWGLSQVPEAILKTILGLLLIAYAFYSLFPASPARGLSERWVYLAGFLAGCLGGAFNIPGPPIVVYGTLRQWERGQFRAVLQVLFTLTGGLTVLSHLVTGRLTQDVGVMYALAVPALVLGIAGGSFADRYINHRAFRAIVTGMIALSGLSLILGGR